MAGGFFTSFNKVRPGAYINFFTVARSLVASVMRRGAGAPPTANLPERNIVVFPMALDWGDPDGLIEVSTEDMLIGRSLANTGLLMSDPNAKLLRGALSYSLNAKIKRINGSGTGAQKASITTNGLLIEAKYTGVLGNKISVTIVEVVGTAFFDVTTFVDGNSVDTQRVTVVGDLNNNSFVEFSGTASAPLVAVPAGVTLTGGNNGVVDITGSYMALRTLLRTTRWNTLAVPDISENANTELFINQLVDEEGRDVMAVLVDAGSIDNDNIINVTQSLVIDGQVYTKSDMAVVAAAMTAGAGVTESNTSKLVIGAESIVDELTNTQIIEALRAGKFIFSSRQNGEIQVEQDINTYRTPTPDKSEIFSKNRIKRTLGGIKYSVSGLWESAFQGKVTNNPENRAVFASSIITLFNELQRIEAITNFAGADDIEVTQGNSLDSVICNAWVQPLDAMEKLYMTVELSV